MAINAMIGARESVTPQTITFRYYLRAQVPAALRPSYANPNAVSVWPNAGNPVLTALRAGNIVERTGIASIPNTGTAAQRQTAARQAVRDALAALEGEIAQQAEWSVTGDTYDGAAGTWTPAGAG